MGSRFNFLNRPFHGLGLLLCPWLPVLFPGANHFARSLDPLLGRAASGDHRCSARAGHWCPTRPVLALVAVIGELDQSQSLCAGQFKPCQSAVVDWPPQTPAHQLRSREAARRGCSQPVLVPVKSPGHAQAGRGNPNQFPLPRESARGSFLGTQSGLQ